MDWFMDYVFPWLMAALMLALCVLIGMLPASAVSGGASSVWLWGLLCALVMTAVCGWIAYMMADMSFYRHQWLAAVVFGIASFAATMYFPADTLINGHKYAAYTREIAPHVAAFGTKRFAEIDNGDGIITDEEMDGALSTLTLDASERRLLEHMDSAQSDVGHVIGSYTTYVWISTGNGGGYFSPIENYIYGISRSDLESYHARMIEKWKHW